MDIKHVFFLLPLSWSILIYIINGTFATTFAITIVGSFFLATILMGALIGLNVIDTGLNDSGTWIVFVIIFGAAFYGITFLGLYNVSFFGFSTSTGLGNRIFTTMPYFDFINLIFGVMYIFGLYLNIATK